jgi:hypothetical protein
MNLIVNLRRSIGLAATESSRHLIGIVLIGCLGF